MRAELTARKSAHLKKPVQAIVKAIRHFLPLAQLSGCLGLSLQLGTGPLLVATGPSCRSQGGFADATGSAASSGGSICIGADWSAATGAQRAFQASKGAERKQRRGSERRSLAKVRLRIEPNKRAPTALFLRNVQIGLKARHRPHEGRRGALQAIRLEPYLRGLRDFITFARPHSCRSRNTADGELGDADSSKSACTSSLAASPRPLPQPSPQCLHSPLLG